MKRVSEEKMISDKSIVQVDYVQLGNHYYITGRFAILNNFGYLSGILFHHAIEMYLKGALLKNLSERNLRKTGHNLKKLWEYYKKYNEGKVDLDSYNKIVKDLDKFYDLRYPLNQNRICFISFDKLKIKQTGGQAPNGKEYILAVEDIDLLVKTYYKIERINPQYFFKTINKMAKEILLKKNKHSILFNGIN